MITIVTNLRLWKKLLLVFVIFSIPILALGHGMLSIVREQVAFAAREIVGTKLLAPILELSHEISDFQVELVSYRNTPSPDAQRRAAEGAATVRTLVTTVRSQLTNRSEALNLHPETSSFAQFEQSLNRLLAMVDTKAEIDSAHFRQTNRALRDLIVEISDHSNLTLDPALDSYYLFDILAQIAPAHLADLGQAELLSLNARGNPGFAVELARIDAFLEELGETRLQGSLGRSLAADADFFGTSPSLQSSLSTNFEEYLSQLRELRRSNALLIRGELEQALPDYSERIHQTQRAAIKLFNAVARELGILLEMRIAEHNTLERNAWISCLVGLLLIPLLTWVTIRGITRPVAALIQVAEAVAQNGDLSREVQISSNDEIGLLGVSLNSMVKSLRRMIQQIQLSGRLVQGSATNISATAKQQQATASEIAATTLQIEATSKEISATSAQLSSTMKEVHHVAEETSSLANTGKEGIERMGDTMQRISEACISISQKLSVLNEKASKINTVVTTINKIADQTNLLSLNAAIEAEKAGEVGRGFSVVASEIRRLADQTAVSTFDIETMVKEMQSAVAAGVMGIDRFADEVRRGVGEVQAVGSHLGTIISRVQTLTPRFELVNEGMASQALGARQITDGLSQLSEAAQQTAESLRQSNLSLEQLKEASSVLHAGVEQFKLEDSQNAAS
jgi:methyl-accepting chemotaxis protein